MNIYLIEMYIYGGIFMEYAKDIIFNVKYDEVKNTIGIKNRKWTSRFKGKIKKHKIISVAIISLIIAIIGDCILITSFINLWGQLM